MKTEDVLQSCWDDVLAGRKTPAECVALFPNIRGLGAQLRAAVALRASQAAMLRPEASRRIEAKLSQQVRALRSARQPHPAGRARWSPAMLRWAAAVSLIVSLLLAGVGTVAASNNSLPGDRLYAVRRAGEAVQLFLTPPSARASVYAALAQRRLEEMTAMSQRGSVDASILVNVINDLTAETDAALTSVENAAPGQQAEILIALVLVTERQQTVLATVQASAPSEAQAGLERALQASSQNHDRAIKHLEQVISERGGPSPSTPGGGSPAASATPTPSGPTQVPPGQAKKTETSPALESTANEPSRQTQVPPGQSQVPPGQTQAPPGQTKVPPGQTKVPPGQTKVPPGQTLVPPGQTQVPPGQTQVPPGQTHAPPGHDDNKKKPGGSS